jgi:hypothetical protein
VGFFVDNVPVVENWMLGMCDVADCINDVRDYCGRIFPINISIV